MPEICVQGVRNPLETILKAQNSATGFTGQNDSTWANKIKARALWESMLIREISLVSKQRK